MELNFFGNKDIKPRLLRLQTLGKPLHNTFSMNLINCMRFKALFICFLLCFCYLQMAEAQIQKPKLYLLAGQDSDHRLFHKYNFDQFDTTAIHYIKPERRENLNHYARRLLTQIDTTQPFYLMGSSIGGMIACEMAKMTHPQKILILASPKCRKELPWRIRVQKHLPFYKIFSGKALKKIALWVQYALEPEGRSETPIFKTMMKDKDPDFMTRGVDMIIRWDNTAIPTNMLHIHGEKDHVIPSKNVKNAVILRKGSHLITITRSLEVQPFLDSLLRIEN
jgi:pimeloyl-ACP methyl ester carboxylesterase